MSKKYFTNFPLVEYNGSAARNILLKSQFFKQVLSSSSSFYSYVVRDGERPDTIAYDYYGSSDYAWLVYFSNSIVDPYFEWPLTDRQLDEHMVKKYGSIEEAQKTIVYYTYNADVNPNDVQYDYNLTYNMDKATYDYKTTYDASFQANLWTAKTAYDYEIQKNDALRPIRLLDSDYLTQVNREISNIFKK